MFVTTVSKGLPYSFFDSVWLYSCHLHVSHVAQKLFLSLFRAMLAQDSKEHFKSSFKHKHMRFVEHISQLPFDMETIRSLYEISNYASRHRTVGIGFPLRLLNLSSTNHEDAARRVFQSKILKCGQLRHGLITSTDINQNLANGYLRTEVVGPLADGMKVGSSMKDKWREDCPRKQSIQKILLEAPMH